MRSETVLNSRRQTSLTFAFHAWRPSFRFRIGLPRKSCLSFGYRQSLVTAQLSMPVAAGKRLSELVFDDVFVRSLPADVEEGIYSREVRGAAYSWVKPTPPKEDDQTRLMHDVGLQRDWKGLSPGLIAWSSEVGKLFDLKEGVEKEEEQLIVEVLGGFGKMLKGMKPYSAAYGGHQFGNWAGQLGDGRAITFGEYVNEKGERWELQLKGAGRTPYSRSADGRAVLRSSIREFLSSEAMFHLRIPTTRALALVSTGVGVVRDMFYDGDPKLEPGAVVTRIAPSFLRLGNFQLPMVREDYDLLKKIADYAIENHFPQFLSESDDIRSDEHNRYASFLREVIVLNAKMVAGWQAIGFVHGVMNTDNFSILGLTIDYGPYGFLDEFDPLYTPNTTDIPGRRYCFGGQPQVGLWNLVQFAQALVPLCGVSSAKDALGAYHDTFKSTFNSYMQAKLGLDRWEKADEELVVDLHQLMAESKADFTNTWRALSAITTESRDVGPIEDALPKGLENRDAWDQWVKRYAKRLEKNESSEGERVRKMHKSNPKYILRNYMVQTAISKAEKGDYSEVNKLLKLIRRPFDEQKGMEKYARIPPAWSKRRGVCVNSCSS